MEDTTVICQVLSSTVVQQWLEIMAESGTIFQTSAPNIWKQVVPDARDFDENTGFVYNEII